MISTGLENPFSSDETGIYPSPFDDYIVISKLKQNKNLQLIEIYSLDGRRVFKQRNTPGESDIIIETSHFSSGIYTIRLLYSDKTLNRKLVKQHQ
jgi:hypothetical protein